MIYLTLFLTFLKIGTFTFGGGHAMIPLIQEEILKHNWMTNEELINFIAISESTPGPFAINISTYVGVQTGGILGAICSTIGVVVTSFIVILIIAKYFEKFKDSNIIKGCMSGLKPAVIGLIGAAIISTAATVFLPEGNFEITMFIKSIIIFVSMLILMRKKAHPIIIIIISAILGILLGSY